MPSSRQTVHAGRTGTWLLSELYPDDPNVAFGLCDLALGFPELRDVRLSESPAVPLNVGILAVAEFDFLQ
ncbi:MAG: DUF2958 domain-containing protein [Pseudomonadota bacterium]|nr:DUF2958 domain-containing protein [Pseudomonadota bacterium]